MSTLAHVVSIRTYALIFGLLLVLTGSTTAIAFADLGRVNDVLMLGIAITKATLVVLYFMHLRYSPWRTTLIALAGVVWLGHILVFTLADYLTRGLVG
jgi:cytochrome c oxidase subunit 4